MFLYIFKKDVLLEFFRIFFLCTATGYTD